jgi:heme/copper-type cytochrome/quinol oxidase subunit 2
MTRNLLTVFTIVVILFAAVATVSAHHSAAATYDTTKHITLKGKVTRVEWKNPHVFYFIDVPDSSGKVVNWAIEASTPNQLYRAGWRKTDLPLGSTVTLDGTSPARNGLAKASGGKLTLPDGRKVLSGYAGNEGEGQ